MFGKGNARWSAARCLEWYVACALFVVFATISPAQDTAASAPSDGAPATQPGTPTTVRPNRGEPTPAETTSSTYRLQPYDLIDVAVYSEEDLHKPARLGSDGTVILPLIGSVKVGGLTVAEATDLITKRYAAGFVKNPSVLITVMQFRRSTFSLLGQVGHPGIYEIPEGTHTSILEALSMAGGFTINASQNGVLVKRVTDGKETMLKVRAGDMMQNPEAAPFEVLTGDTILVPSVPTERNNFTVLGQIAKPGLYAIPAGTHVTIFDAISLAGGFSLNASQSRVTVKRTSGGKTDLLHVNVSDIAQNPNAAPVEILPGDTIYVPFRNSTFSILGQVTKPGTYEIAEGSHLNIIEAILMAGGFTRIAAQNSVLVKRTVNGKPTTVKVHAKDMASEPDVAPFEVLPGDIISVPESIL